jgi:hypothetical protein
MIPRRRDLLAGIGTAAFAGCLAPDGDGGGSPTERGGAKATPDTGGSRHFPEDVGPDEVGYTHLRADGNRVVEGVGTIPASTPTDHQVSGTPAWLVGIPAAGPDDTPATRTPAVTALAVVRTPHIGGTVEFYSFEAGDPEIVATLSGYSTHTIGSRNLDGGVAGDFDGDGRVELLVPTDDRRTLAGIRRTDGGARETWRLPIGGDVSTNVLAVTGPEGITVAVGRADGTVRLWR